MDGESYRCQEATASGKGRGGVEVGWQTGKEA
jgi:hypothetical protein